MKDSVNLLPRRPHAVTDEVASAADLVVQLCAFFIGAEEYVLDIMRVEEILPLQRITPIPHAPAFVEGVVHLRGLILPVVDLRFRLLGAPGPETPKTRLLVCKLGTRRVAVKVDRVAEVLRVRRGDIKPAPALMVAGHTPFVVGVCGPPDRLRLLLDLKALLRVELERESSRNTT
ncbi:MULTISPECIES: chemotaxis protein CheW [Myxococcus]|uniref:Chemotaxis protein CheW n=1 Tax=Myxococcus xanthus TaxID=34 RepID=A0AAE6G2C1_MYXXA|nr:MULTISPECIES: chemotaxis protein CheW [Myxococcus]QDE69710.1 chemotaxis protein CheW [Myxococcus xanthus]QDE76989.1 chemotaxis protein CheW [Myxococcus xanthus]WAM23721.1 chemotaxis protein CheW [Myxococcus sp. NMCA1]